MCAVFVVGLTAAYIGYGEPTKIEELSAKNICGPLTLAFTAEYLGVQQAFDRVFEIMPPSGDPRSLLDLGQAAQKLGLATSAIKWKPSQVADLKAPAIIRLDTGSPDGIGHFVVLLRASGNSVQVIDVPHRPQWTTFEGIWRSWDGIALYVGTSSDELPSAAGVTRRAEFALMACLLGILVLLLLFSTVFVIRSEAGKLCWYLYPHISLTGGRITMITAVSAASVAALCAWGIVSSGVDSSESVGTLRADPGFLEVRVPHLDGEVRANTVGATVRIYNDGADDVTIAEVSTSCGCAAPSISSQRLPARGYAEMSVVVKPPIAGTKNFVLRVRFKEFGDQWLEIPGFVKVL